jgi:hypothetical protein
LSYVQTGKKTDKCGYDPYGVECGSGVDVAPGSDDPGLCDGYAPHTSDLLHPVGVQREIEACPAGHGDLWARILSTLIFFLVQVAKYRPSGGGVGRRYSP